MTTLQLEKYSILLEDLFKLEVSFKFSNEKKYFLLNHLAQECFHVDTNQIGTNRAIFLRYKDETIVTYLLNEYTFNNQYIQKIEKLSLLIKQIHRQKNIELLLATLFTKGGKYANFLYFKDTVQAGEIIRSLHQIVQKSS